MEKPSFAALTKIAVIFSVVVFHQILIAQNVPGGSRGHDQPLPAPARPVDGQYFRVVTNQVFNTQKSILWRELKGTVYGPAERGLLFVNKPDGSLVAVRNYTGSSRAGQYFRTLAMVVGQTKIGGWDYELWDCGTPYTGKIPGLAAGDSAELQKVTAQVEALRKEWHTLDRQHAKLSEVLTNKRATGQPVIGEQSQMAKIRQAQGKVAVALKQAQTRKAELEAKVK